MESTHVNVTEQQFEQAKRDSFVTMQDYFCSGQLIMCMLQEDPHPEFPHLPKGDTASFEVRMFVRESDRITFLNDTLRQHRNLTYTQAIDAMAQQMKAERDYLG